LEQVSQLIATTSEAIPVATASPPEWTWLLPLIVGFVALAGVVVTAAVAIWNIRKQLNSAHSLKVAEMRHAWVNNLRDAMATYQSYGVSPIGDQTTQREFYEKGTRIELFMDPEHPDYGELQRCMQEFVLTGGTTDRSSANAAYVAVCQRIIKHEWERLEAEIRAA
jgi:hypothetical protein